MLYMSKLCFCNCPCPSWCWRLAEVSLEVWGFSVTLRRHVPSHLPSGKRLFGKNHLESYYPGNDCLLCNRIRVINCCVYYNVLVISVYGIVLSCVYSRVVKFCRIISLGCRDYLRNDPNCFWGGGTWRRESFVLNRLLTAIIISVMLAYVYSEVLFLFFFLQWPKK